MSWAQAKQRILRRIRQGTDLNSVNTRYRVVLAVRHDISSARYGYQNEAGFVVQIGRNSSITIPLSMLRTCYGALSGPPGYDGDFFRQHFPLQAQDHPCRVHVVGQIFVTAGLARRNGNRYR